MRTTTLNRREIKVRSRTIDIFFCPLFMIVIAGMIASYIVDLRREECGEDARFQQMLPHVQIVIFFSCVLLVVVFMCFLFAVTKECEKSCAKCKRGADENAGLSSDEEDEVERRKQIDAFRRAQEERRNRQE